MLLCAGLYWWGGNAPGLRGWSVSKNAPETQNINNRQSALPDKGQENTDGERFTCTLSIRCDTILDNLDWMDPDKLELVPSDGVIFEEKTVNFNQGESVFDVLLREMQNAGIHLEFENTPMYGSAYIEGIANIYEFDCGELSGWMYKVNDLFPNYGCSAYRLENGDRVEFVYTCDYGIDVGGSYATGNGENPNE